MHATPPAGTSNWGTLTRLFTKGAQQGPGFDKSIPYFPKNENHFPLVRENGKHFHGEQIDRNRIVCCDMSTQWLMDNLLGKKPEDGTYQGADINLLGGKPAYESYAGTNVAEHVAPNSKDIYTAALREASVQICDNDQLGKHLSDKFAEMELADQTKAGCFFESANHSMAIALKIKIKDGVKRYVVNVYDPHMSATHVRLAVDEPLNQSTLDKLTAKELLGEKHYSAYFGESRTSCLAFIDQAQLAEIVDKADQGEPILSELVSSKKASIDFPIETLDATHIFHMLSQGCDQNLQELMPKFKQLQETDPQKLCNLVLAGTEVGGYGLGHAINSGQTKSISVWLAMFKLVPVDAKMTLLTQACNGVLRDALADGNIKAMKAMKEILLEVDADQRGALLKALTADGLEQAFREGNLDAVRAYGELWKSVSPESPQLFELAEQASEASLKQVSPQDKAGTVQTFVEFLKYVSPSQRVDLLNRFGKPYATKALECGNVPAFQQYTKLLNSMPAEDRLKLLVDSDPKDRDSLTASLIKAEQIDGRKNMFFKLKTFFKSLLNLCVSKTPGALERYVSMVNKAIPEADRATIKGSNDERLKLLFLGDKDEDGLIFKAFGSASISEQGKYLEMLEEFHLHNDFIAAMAKHNNLVSDDTEFIKRGEVPQ